MSSVYGLLALQSLVEHIPVAVAGLYALAIIIAFAVGCVKGFRKVAWGGFYWGLAGVAFIAAYKFLGPKNPLASSLTGNLAGAANFLWMMILLIGGVAFSLILYGCCGLMFRPKEVVLKPEVEVDECGFVYEDEREDDSNIYQVPPVFIKGGGKPTTFARIAGGFMATVNVLAVLISFTAVALIVVGQTSLSQGSLGSFLQYNLVKKALGYSLAYTFDFLTVGMIILIAFKGFNTGFLGSMRVVLMVIIWFISDDVALIIPFTKASSYPIVSQLIQRCSVLYASLKPTYAGILAKLTAGLIMATIATILVLIINYLLGKAIEGVESHRTTLVIDEVAAVILYLFLGVIAVASVWAMLYFADYCGIVNVSATFNENSLIGKGFFEFAETYLKGFADKYLMKFAA